MAEALRSHGTSFADAGGAEQRAEEACLPAVTAKDSMMASVDYSGLPAAAETDGTPVGLGELIGIISEELDEAFAEGGAGDAVNLQSRSRVAQAMRCLDVSDGCLDEYRHFEPEKKYTRNLIATDNERFTLMLICWNGGKESPIHDHPCRGCWMRVVEGSVVETRYERKAGALVESGRGEFSSPSVAYVHDSMGLHKVGAAAGCERACTLHLYAPPFDRCCVWLDAARPDHTLKPVVTYHSEFGEVVDYAPPSQRATITDACSEDDQDGAAGSSAGGGSELD